MLASIVLIAVDLVLSCIVYSRRNYSDYKNSQELAFLFFFLLVCLLCFLYGFVLVIQGDNKKVTQYKPDGENGDKVVVDSDENTNQNQEDKKDDKNNLTNTGAVEKENNNKPL